MQQNHTPGTLVVLTEERIFALIVAAVAQALAGREADPVDWIDGKAAAKILGVAPRSVQKLAKRSGLPAHRVGAKLLRFRRSEVLAWLEKRSAK